MVALAEDHLVPKTESNDSDKIVLMDLDKVPKKRRVNFNLTIDIKQESNDACVPQGPNSLSDFSDGESLSDSYVPIPTTPGGKPQVIQLILFDFLDDLGVKNRKLKSFFCLKIMKICHFSYPHSHLECPTKSMKRSDYV